MTDGSILKILRLNKPCRFDSGHLHQSNTKDLSDSRGIIFLSKIQKFYKNFFTIVFVELFSYNFNKLLTTSPVTTLADLSR